MMRRHDMEDTRIVYGFNCVWWDGVEKVGKSQPGATGVSIPVCPHCGSVLMELPSPKQWWDGVEKYEKNGHPGYRAFIEWLKGKCFRTRQDAQAAYESKPGRRVIL